MGNRYVTVDIAQETQPQSQASFGTALVLSTDKAAVYKEYSGDTALATIGTDFGADSKTYKLAEKMFGQSPKPAKIAILGVAYATATDPTTKLTTALNDLMKTNNDFFYVVSTEQAKKEIEALAAWVSTQQKFYFVSVTKVVADTLTNLPRNVVVFVHNDPTTYPAEALVGAISPLAIGSYTITFQNLNGIEPVTYDISDVNAIEAKNFITYIRESGKNIVSAGKTAGGEYFDLVQGEFYLKAQLEQNVFNVFTRGKTKVPFSQNGINMVVAVVSGTLGAEVEDVTTGEGIIARDADQNAQFTVETPLISDIPDADKSNRKLPGVKWVATVAGAIENAKISGTMQL